MSTGTWGERSVSRCDHTSEPLDRATSVSRRRFAKASSEESSLLVVELHFEKENLGTEQMVLRRWYWPAVIIYCPPDTLVLFLQSWTSSSQTSLKMCLQSIFWETITSREVCNLPPLPSTFMSLITSCPLAGHDLTQQSWPRLSSPRWPLLLCPLISPLSSSLSSPVKLSHWSSFYWVLLSAPSPPVQAPVPFWIWMDLL